MSRNMIDANSYIFETLTAFVIEKDVSVPIPGKNVYCIATNDSDKEWLKELEILNVQPILPSFKTASFKFRDDKYFVTVGQEFRLESEECIQLIDLNAGAVTALLFELKVKVSVTSHSSALEIIEEVFYEQEERIVRHDFNLVAKFFEPIAIYKLQDNSPFAANNKISITRASGFYIIKACQPISLRFSTQTLILFEKIFVEGTNSVPYESVLFSLVSVYWKYAFLDIYRCIERLFCVAALEEFHQSLSISNSLLKFSIDVEKYTGWRPKENVALNKLIDSSPDEALKLLQQIKAQIDGSSEGKCGDLVYKIRNSIVHFRPATEQVELENDCWDKLIESCLLVIKHWYQVYDESLMAE